jgi:hypothetical protein
MKLYNASGYLELGYCNKLTRIVDTTSYCFRLTCMTFCSIKVNASWNEHSRSHLDQFTNAVNQSISKK